MVKCFREAGWMLNPSKATMFEWARIPQEFEDSETFAVELLKQCGIIVTPGTAFGPEGKRYVRLALVVEDDQIIEAGKRLKDCTFFQRNHVQ